MVSHQPMDFPSGPGPLGPWGLGRFAFATPEQQKEASDLATAVSPLPEVHIIDDVSAIGR